MLVLSVACSSAPSVPSASAGNKPVVVVQQPANGALLAPGQNVVSGAASDTVGVDHVTLLVDGVSVASTPPGVPATLMPFMLNWLATPGGHMLQVIAFRADGTQSDPAVVQVTVGATASGLPASFATFALPTVGLPSTPKPTRKPRRTQAPTIAPSQAPTLLPTTNTPTATPAPPTAPPSMPPTPDANGYAPDDTTSEPRQIVLAASNVACPAGPPASAVGCVSEQISAPAGDNADQFFIVLAANTSYMFKMTSCSDQSDGTVFEYPGQDPSLVNGCGDWAILTTAATAAAQISFDVKFGTVGGQTYNQYQVTVYQCAFANCGTQ
jgi:Big-like domain-containing protein